MNCPFQSVVFDFDYTLADSSEGIVECINYALDHLGLPIASAEKACRTIGLSLQDTFRELAGERDGGAAEEFFRLFVERADRVMNEMTVLYPAVPPAVTQLRQWGINLGIVSSKYRYRIEDFLTREGLSSEFTVIVGFEDVSQSKPDPEGLHKAMAQLHTSPLQTLYVGDSLVDVETARRADVPFVAVLTGVTPEREFTARGVANIVEGLHQLPEWLAKGSLRQ